MPDTAFALYVACSIVSGYGLALFLWWWVRVGEASAVYRYITWLFIGIFIQSSVNVYSRTMTLCGDHSYLLAWWWPLRGVIVLVCLVLITGNMTWRLFYRGGLYGRDKK